MKKFKTFKIKLVKTKKHYLKIKNKKIYYILKIFIKMVPIKAKIKV
jgi:hypothetical protein